MAHGICTEDRLRRATRGEQLTYRWLAEALPDPYWVWHEPIAKDRRPDFVVFGPSLGLAVLEVKDWSANAIRGVTADRVEVQHGSSSSVDTHPATQAEGAAFAICDALRKSPTCRQPGGDHQGKLRFPWAAGGVLPNLSRAEAAATALDRVCSPDRLLCGDEIGEPGAWRLRGQKLVERLSRMFTVRFDFQMTPRLREVVHQALYPEVSLDRDYAGRARGTVSPQVWLPLEVARTLDDDQWEFARSLGTGHKVLQGVVGSGKTEVVAARTRLLAESNPTWRILVLCYNISLAGWLRARVFDGGRLQSFPVTVAHVHGWCRDLLERAGVRWTPEIYTQEDGFIALVRDALRDGRIRQRYDAILIDEAQDLSVPMLETCMAALDSGRESLLLALDNAQQIYDGRVRELSKVGVQAKGANTVPLRTNHRSSREINRFSRRFLWGDVPEGDTVRVGNHTALIPISSGRSSAPVEVVHCADVGEQVAYAAAFCRSLVDEGMLPDEIAVLYRSRRVHSTGEPHRRGDYDEPIDLVEACRRGFDAERLGLVWIAEGSASKQDASLAHGKIALSTIHSFKGLEARAVVLLGAETEASAVESASIEQHLLYVGMTRATDQLVVPWSNPKGLGASLEGLSA